MPVTRVQATPLDDKRVADRVYDEPRRVEGLWEASVERGGAHPRFNGEPSGDCCGRWTPDGRYFIFYRQGQI